MAVDVPGGRAFDISADRHAGQLKKRDSEILRRTCQDVGNRQAGQR